MENASFIGTAVSKSKRLIRDYRPGGSGDSSKCNGMRCMPLSGTIQITTIPVLLVVFLLVPRISGASPKRLPLFSAVMRWA
jgi:hypothetical protein